MSDAASPTTRRALVQETIRRLEAAGVAEARRNAEWMVMDVIGCARSALLAYPERAVSAEQAEHVRRLAVRRAQREPLQYVLGHTEFFGLHVRVTPDVLIPRPETEQVVEEALQLLHEVRAPRVLDVGTGSGCIALAMKHERPDADVHACDLSEAALRVARQNAARLGLGVQFHRADVLAPPFVEIATARFDLIISNPPYIALDEAESLAPEVHDYEPHLALFAGDDPLLFYRAVARHAKALLKPGGVLVFETHAYHAGEVREMLESFTYEAVRLQRDLAGHPRILSARWPAGGTAR